MAEQLSGERRAILALPQPVFSWEEDPLRSIACCLVAGWLDDETLLFESDSYETLRLLARDVTSGDIRVVATLPATWEFQVAIRGPPQRGARRLSLVEPGRRSASTSPRNAQRGEHRGPRRR